jgi:hypothetical protein
MRFDHSLATLAIAVVVHVQALVQSPAQAQPTTKAELTIEIAGALLKHGGLVTVYPIKVPAEEWSGIAAGSPATVRIDGRYTEIQLRYPASGTYTYRFRPVDLPAADKYGTQTLSIIGTDAEDRGPRMTAGFTDAYSSGGRIIRVPPLAEIFGEGEAERSNARWGITQAYADPPPADQRSARAFLVIARDRDRRPPLACAGGANVQICTFAPEHWTRLDALWWRAVAEARIERMRDRAVRRCHDSSWTSGRCDAVPTSDEPEFVKR